MNAQDESNATASVRTGQHNGRGVYWSFLLAVVWSLSLVSTAKAADNGMPDLGTNASLHGAQLFPATLIGSRALAVYGDVDGPSAANNRLWSRK